MSESHPDAVRIDDSERQAAMDALGEHFTAGRLDVDEYGDRTAKVTACRTRGELVELFADLPGPGPRFGAVEPAKPAPIVVTTGGALHRHQRPAAVRAAAVLVTLSWFAAIVLFFTQGYLIAFLVPIGLSCVFGAWWGKDWKDR